MYPHDAVRHDDEHDHDHGHAPAVDAAPAPGFCEVMETAVRELLEQKGLIEAADIIDRST